MHDNNNGDGERETTGPLLLLQSELFAQWLARFLYWVERGLMRVPQRCFERTLGLVREGGVVWQMELLTRVERESAAALLAVPGAMTTMTTTQPAPCSSEQAWLRVAEWLAASGEFLYVADSVASQFMALVDALERGTPPGKVLKSAVLDASAIRVGQLRALGLRAGARGGFLYGGVRDTLCDNMLQLARHMAVGPLDLESYHGGHAQRTVRCALVHFVACLQAYDALVDPSRVVALQGFSDIPVVFTRFVPFEHTVPLALRKELERCAVMENKCRRWVFSGGGTATRGKEGEEEEEEEDGGGDCHKGVRVRKCMRYAASLSRLLAVLAHHGDAVLLQQLDPILGFVHGALNSVLDCLVQLLRPRRAFGWHAAPLHEKQLLVMAAHCSREACGTIVGEDVEAFADNSIDAGSQHEDDDEDEEEEEKEEEEEEVQWTPALLAEQAQRLVGSVDDHDWQRFRCVAEPQFGALQLFLAPSSSSPRAELSRDARRAVLCNMHSLSLEMQGLLHGASDAWVTSLLPRAVDDDTQQGGGWCKYLAGGAIAPPVVDVDGGGDDDQLHRAALICLRFIQKTHGFRASTQHGITKALLMHATLWRDWAKRGEAGGKKQ